MKSRKVPPTRKLPKPGTSLPERPTKNLAAGFNLAWFCVLVVLLPLLFSKETIDPVFSIRYLFLSCFVFLYVTCRILPGRSPLFVPEQPFFRALLLLAAGYTAWCIIGAFFSVNSGAADLEISRFVLDLVVAVLFFAAFSAAGERERLNLFQTLVAVSLVQTVIVLLQYYERGFMDIPGTERPFGMMGHRNLFSSAQVCLFPFAAFVLYKGSPLWKWLAGAALAGIFVSVTISLTRSSWLSLLVGTLAVFVLLWFFAPQQRKVWASSFLFAFLGCTVLLAGLWMTDQRGTIARSVSERAVHLVHATSDSAEGTQSARLRVQLWMSSLRLLGHHPVAGVGSGNWKLAVGNYGQQVMTWNDGEAIPGRAHNVYLQIACETGIPGLLLYLSFWLLIIGGGIRIVTLNRSPDLKILTILMVGGLLSFATDNLFSFAPERIEHSLYAVIMGVVVVVSSSTAFPVKRYDSGRLALWWALAALAVAGWNGFLAYTLYEVEQHESKAASLLEAGRFGEVLEEVRQAKSRFVTLGAGGESLEMLSAAAYRELNDEKQALLEIYVASRRHPNNPRMWALMGVVYADLQRYDSTIACYKKALDLAPRYRTAWINLAYTYFETKQYTPCLMSIRQAHPGPADRELLELYRQALQKRATQPHQ